MAGLSCLRLLLRLRWDRSTDASEAMAREIAEKRTRVEQGRRRSYRELWQAQSGEYYVARMGRLDSGPAGWRVSSRLRLEAYCREHIAALCAMEVW